jgi:hypothetical protein
MAFIVPGEAAAAADPGERQLHDPALGQDHEAVAVAAAHDLQCPRPGPCDGGFHLRALISGVADDALHEREAPARLPQQGFGAVAVLDVGRTDGDRQKEPQRVGQDVALAAERFLFGIVAGPVERSPPLSAPFAVWLSMRAVVGLAARPACSRTST